MERDSFIFYASFFNGIDKLPEENQLELYRAVCTYALNGEIIDLSPISEAMFSLIKPQIDANNKRYADGKKGGRPKKTSGNEENEEEKTSGYENKKPVVMKKTKTKKPNVNENVNENVNVNVNDNVNENVNVKENKKERKKTFDTIIENYTTNIDLQDELKNHLAVRKQKKGALTDRAIELELKKLDELSSSDYEKIKIVRQSIANGWVGFFELSENKNSRKNVNWFAEIGREEGVF